MSSGSYVRKKQAEVNSDEMVAINQCMLSFASVQSTT